MVASLALGQSYDCPSASEATMMDMDKGITYDCPSASEVTLKIMGKI